MAWCPKCKSEYVEGITECAECHVPLVDEEPREEVEYIPTDWSLVAEYTDSEMGILAKGLLQQNDIECRVEDMTFHAYPVPVSQNLTRVKVWVEGGNKEKAEKLLEEAEKYNICSECGSVIFKEDDRCPGCGVLLDD